MNFISSLVRISVLALLTFAQTSNAQTPPGEITNLQVRSSATNAAGTALGMQPDLVLPSFFDIHILGSSSALVPNGTYDGYCLNRPIPVTLAPVQHYSDAFNGDSMAAWITASAFSSSQQVIDRINWVVSQNFTSDAKYDAEGTIGVPEIGTSGFNFGEVQGAIWSIMGDPFVIYFPLEDVFLNDNNRQQVIEADIDLLIARSLAAVTSSINVDPVFSDATAVLDTAITSNDNNAQPLIVQLNSAKLGNYVWVDSDSDGTQNEVNTGLDGVTVNLLNSGDTIIATTTTGDDFSTAIVETGYYQFTGLIPGVYSVQVVKPTGYDFTDQDQGGDTVDSDVDTTTGTTTSITINAGDNDQTWDAGLVVAELVSVGNIVWLDDGAGGGVANNGLIDGTESGIGSVNLELYTTGQTPGTDAPTATTTTNGDGTYVFNDLAQATYFVHISVSEFAAGQPLVGLQSSTGQSAADTDDDNVDENGDDDESDGVSSPDYSLTANSLPTAEAGFDGNATSTQDDDNTDMTVDFGFYLPPELVSIGNIVWLDDGAGGGVANNGLIDGTESGIGSVDLELYTTGQTPGTDAPTATTTTNGDGTYVFNDLAQATYFVHIPVSEFAAGQPLVGLQSSTGQSAADTDDDNVDENGDDDESDGVSSPDYTLTANALPTTEAGFGGAATSTQDDDNTDMTVDFGFYLPPELVSIGNIVWLDDGAGVANNGLIDGTESGIGSVDLELYTTGQTPGTDAPTATTTTNGDGTYVFNDLAQATYFVHIPVSEFAAGQPLAGLQSSTGQSVADTDDDNVDENGDDDESDGVSSPDYSLTANSLPTAEAGFDGNATSTQDDDNTDMTVDFGFYNTSSAALSIVKSMTNNLDEDASGTVTVNDTLTFTITATNTGTTILNNVIVTDNMITPNNITCLVVPATGTCILVGTYVVTPVDVSSNSIVNTAQAVSTETTSTPVSVIETVMVAGVIPAVIPSLTIWPILLMILLIASIGFLGIKSRSL